MILSSQATDNRDPSTWTALIVDDDDADVFWVEKALEYFEFQGRPFRTVRAYSADEAMRMCNQLDDIKLLITDLVMETVDAGLKLVSRLAESCLTKNGTQRPAFVAILMTGNPHLVSPWALDGSVISSVYDKNERSGTKFRAHLAAALLQRQE